MESGVEARHSTNTTLRSRLAVVRLVHGNDVVQIGEIRRIERIHVMKSKDLGVLKNTRSSHKVSREVLLELAGETQVVSKLCLL